MADPDLQIRGGEGVIKTLRKGGALSQNVFPGGHAGPGPRAPPLDPPLKRSCYTFVSHNYLILLLKPMTTRISFCLG